MAAKLSRQLRWQLRQMELGNCRICGDPAAFQAYCPQCKIIRRECARARYGYKRRYNSASYRKSGKPLFVLAEAKTGTTHQNGAREAISSVVHKRERSSPDLSANLLRLNGLQPLLAGAKP